MINLRIINNYRIDEWKTICKSQAVNYPLFTNKDVNCFYSGCDLLRLKIKKMVSARLGCGSIKRKRSVLKEI